MPEYFPFEYRTPDSQYGDLLYRILRHGKVVETRQDVNARTIMQGTMSFEFSNGFPVITDRSLKSFWNRSIGELCAFINGVTTVEGLIEFGCTWWEPWADNTRTELFGLQPGEIGPASYGGAFHDFPTLDGGRFDQFANLPKQISRLPYDRVHFVTPWMPQENSRAEPGLQKTTIAPCHGWVHVRIINDELHLHLYQRAGDTPVGVPSNMVQYAALALMLEHLTGFAATAFYHTISDAHIFENQLENVLDLLQRPPLRLPTVQLTEEGKKIADIHDFRREHFELTDYEPHPAMPGIPVST
jgi:thymidylate synthase